MKCISSYLSITDLAEWLHFIQHCIKCAGSIIIGKGCLPPSFHASLSWVTSYFQTWPQWTLLVSNTSEIQYSGPIIVAIPYGSQSLLQGPGLLNLHAASVTPGTYHNVPEEMRWKQSLHIVSPYMAPHQGLWILLCPICPGLGENPGKGMNN